MWNTGPFHGGEGSPGDRGILGGTLGVPMAPEYPAFLPASLLGLIRGLMGLFLALLLKLHIIEAFVLCG